MADFMPTNAIQTRKAGYVPVTDSTCILGTEIRREFRILPFNLPSILLPRLSPRCFFNAVSPTLPTVLVMRNVRSFLLLCISSLLFDWKREIVSENRGIILFRCFFFFFFYE